MNLTNYHSHCSFCDGRAPMEEFVKSAIATGFTAYGVSSHAPLPFPTHWTLERTKVSAYLREIGALKEKYAGQIELYAGMEIDYLNEEQNPANEYFQGLPLDYRIGSVHLVYTDDGEIIDTDAGTEGFALLLRDYFQGNLRRLVERYYEASMRMVEAGGFDFIGHADKIFYNAEYCEPGVTEQGWYKELREGLFRRIAEKGLMLEINTKAYLSKGCFFPARQHFETIRRLGIPVVVNSDTHFPELVNAGRREALELLRASGFTSVCELHRGQWMEVEIDL
ncbi:MAG: histidinol-phosphatase [Odoribacter sp.]|nr:histidinol-phosphatase [Odoribacter sp.]